MIQAEEGRIPSLGDHCAQSGAIEADYRDWIALLKPRVLTLVVFTGAIGLLVAPGHLNPVLAFTAILCITVARRGLRRDQHVVRPRHRRDHAPHPQPADSRRAASSPGRPWVSA